MTGQEAHEKSKELLIALNELFLSLPDKETTSAKDLRAIDLNADQIQCIAEEMQYWSRHGEKKTGLVEPQ